MGEEQDLAVAVETAWVGFRRWPADRLAALERDEHLLVEVETGSDPDELEGAAPYLQFVAWGDDLTIRAEAVSNHYLDRPYQHGTDEIVLLSQEWELPDDDCRNWFRDVAQRDVDQLAVACVQVLREVHGVQHPAFLSADGLDRSGEVTESPVSPQPDLGEDESALPGDFDELVTLVDAALAEMSDDEVTHDPDGDVPFRSGLSVVFVRVREDRPGIEIFAEIVSEPDRPERLPVELDILNRTHEIAKFYVAGPTVRMSHEIVAWPFSPLQLRTVLRRFLTEVDGIAESLAQRIGGRRFLEEPQVDDTDTTPTHAGMVSLLELLHLGPVPSPVVAALFEHDRKVITFHLTNIRRGYVDCGDHDAEQVLTCLRRGLLHVVTGEVPERRPRRVPPRPRSEQPSLIGDDDIGEDTLDLGRSA